MKRIGVSVFAVAMCLIGCVKEQSTQTPVDRAEGAKARGPAEPRRDASVDVDLDKLGATISQNSAAAVANPKVEAALDELVQAIGADARVAQSGERWFTDLGVAPSLAPGRDAVVARISGLPEMLHLVQRLQREHPHATPDELGTLAEAWIAGVVDGANFDRAMDGAFDKFFALPEIDAAFTAFGEKVSQNRHLAGTIRDASRDAAASWRRRLLERNQGVLPDRRRATEILTEELLSTERVADWMAKLYRLPAVKRELAGGVARVLDAPSFRRISVDSVRKLLDDRVFQDRTIELIALLLGEKPSTKAIEGAVDKLLASPVVVPTVAAWLAATLADPALSVVGDGVLEALAGSPDVRASLVELLAGE